MTLKLIYPHDRRTLEPRAMRARQVWRLAEQAREQIMWRRPSPCLDVDRLIRVAKTMVVNGRAIATQWDLQRDVRDEHGCQALGVTEADPALPGVVLVSLNAALIAERDYLKRSTLAHELGHALFDGPSMLRQASKPAFAMVTPDEAHLATPRRADGGMDWREFRANEFMGALLAPRPLLQRQLGRRSIALGLPLYDAGGGELVIRASDDPTRLDELLFDLAERFGVSAAFIEYRLHRYALVQ